MRAQRKKRQAEQDEDDDLVSMPAWVIDHNTHNLWQLGVDESMMPKDVVPSAASTAQIFRLREWAASETKRRSAQRATAAAAAAAAIASPQAPTLQAPPQVPFVRQEMPPTLSSLDINLLRNAADPHVPNQATLALASRLAAGPRVGVSPTSVMDRE